MADAPHREITLTDGRVLAYAEYGSPSGQPIIYCHGTPSARVEGELIVDRAIAAELPIAHCSGKSASATASSRVSKSLAGRARADRPPTWRFSRGPGDSISRLLRCRFGYGTECATATSLSRAAATSRRCFRIAARRTTKTMRIFHFRSITNERC